MPDQTKPGGVIGFLCAAADFVVSHGVPAIDAALNGLKPETREAALWAGARYGLGKLRGSDPEKSPLLPLAMRLFPKPVALRILADLFAKADAELEAHPPN